MPFIQLTRGKQTRVDTEDFNRLNQFKWFAQLGSDKGVFYAARCITHSGRQVTIRMHREILGSRYRDGRIVDHINHDTLDNRQCNLRRCSSSDNNCNCGNYKKGTSIYKGVSWHKQNQNSGKWQAQIQKNGKHYYLGVFESEKDAALAYNEAALRIHGQFAFQNQVEDQ